MLNRFARASLPAVPLAAILTALLSVVDVSTKALFPWLSRVRASSAWETAVWAFTNQIGAVALDTKGLREQRFKLAEDAKAILAKAAEEGREMLRSDEEEQYNRLHVDIDALGRHIDAREKQDELEERLARPSGRKTTASSPESERAAGTDADGTVALSRLKRGQVESLEAFRTWALAGSDQRPAQEAIDRAKRIGVDINQRQMVLSMSHRAMRSLHEPWEYRAAQGVGSGGIGGFTVPDELMQALETAMLTFGGMRQTSTILRTGSGSDLPIPMANDTGNKGAIVAENAATTEQGTTFSQLVLNSYKYSSKYILISVELMQDSAINMAEFLGSALGERIGRITNEHFTTGTGTGQPNGIVTAATLGKQGDSGQSTSITYGHLVDLEHSVDPSYRTGARWMFADSTLKVIKKLVDSQNRPLWSAGLAVREPDTILGYPYTINQDVAAMTASAKSVLFGQLNKYIVRDVRDITLIRLDERFAEYGQVAFLAFSRHDGDLKDAGTHPVKYYQNSAS